MTLECSRPGFQVPNVFVKNNCEVSLKFYGKNNIDVEPVCIHSLIKKTKKQNKAIVQPRAQGLLGIQNGGSEETLANSESRVSKNIGDFECFKLAACFVISLFKVT